MIKKIATQNREEWKALRRDYIGGSDAASVIGLNPYKSAYSLWAEKTGKIPEFEGNLATDVGTYMEDFIAKKFEQETGKKVRRESRSILNDKYPWAIANYDRLIVGEDAGLECKFTDSLNLKKYKNGEYPERFYAQCVHYLAVSGKQRWYLAVLIGNKEFKWFCIERDEEEIAALMGEEEKMSVCIKTNTPPMVDGTESTSKTIGAIYPDSNADTVNLMAYETDLMQYLALSAQIKALEEQQAEMANRVKAFMNEAGKGESNRYKVSWSTSSRRNFDTKAFQADHKDIDLNKYYKTSSYRTFKVSERGA
jgi:putative phage-type endonuclease